MKKNKDQQTEIIYPVKTICLAIFLSLIFYPISTTLGQTYWSSVPSYGVSVLYSDEHRIVMQIEVFNFHTDRVTVSGNEYYKVRLVDNGDGLRPGTTFDIGKPELPGIFRLVGIPEGASWQFTILEANVDSIKGINIYPLQPQTTKPIDTRREREFIIDRNFYTTHQFYPTELIRVDYLGVWRDINVAVLRVYPFAYNPGNNTLIVYNRLVVQLSYEGYGFVPKRVSPEYFRMYKSAILNFESMGIEMENEGIAVVTSPLQDESFKYLVITHDEFIPAISPLVNWHHKRGISIKMVPVCSVGTTPQAIKTYIADKYYEYGIKYVLFVGDAEHIPLYNWEREFYSCPSQYWYACITGDSVPDLLPDVYVSRFSVKNVDELSNQVHKTLKYMKNPPLDRWLTRSILCAHNELFPDNYATFKENIRRYQYSFFNPIFDTAYGRSNGRTAQVISAINEGRNIVNYRGHGSSTSWNRWDCHDDYLYDSDIRYLQNTRTPIVLNLCCLTGNIEHYECLCETWMKAEGGAVAAYGGTRTTNTEPHNIFDEHFFKGFCNVLPRLVCFGDLIYFAYAQTIAYGPDAEVNAMQCVLLGDLMIEVGTRIPTTMVVKHDSAIFAWDTLLVVTVMTQSPSVPIRNALVCIMKAEDEFYAYGLTSRDGNITFPLSLSTGGTLDITVTFHGYLPYEGSVVVSDVEVEEISEIRDTRLEISPNPFVKKATIRIYHSYPRAEQEQAFLKIYDVSGRVIKIFNYLPGQQFNQIIWDGTDL